MARAFTIAEDGDYNEQRWWPQWTSDHFPSYQAFWVSRIVPVTYRVKNRRDVAFQTNAELAAAGYTEEDVAIAQLHYTLLMHLGRVFELLDDARAFTIRSHLGNRGGRDEFFESFARLSGASDVADELLARRADPGRYDAWDESEGAKARRAWRRSHPDPLQPVRAYRNRLIHGRVVPEVYVNTQDEQGRRGQMLFYPRLGVVDFVPGLEDRLRGSPWRRPAARLRRGGADRARRLGEGHRVRRAGMAAAPAAQPVAVAGTCPKERLRDAAHVR